MTQRWRMLLHSMQEMTRLIIIPGLILVSCQLEKKGKHGSIKRDVVDSVITVMGKTPEKIYGLDEIYLRYISKELLSHIEKEHPTWSVPGQNLWYPRLFNKYKTNSSLVNFNQGDFDCNGKTDYALILYKGKNQFAAVAFLRMDAGFKTVELTEIRSPECEKFDFALTLYKPGRYDIADPDLGPSDAKYVNLACSGVGVGMFKELYEGGDDVYYWEGDQLRSCVIEK